MGVTKRVTSDRHSELTLRQMQELLDAFDPFFKSRANLVGHVISRLHFYVFDVLFNSESAREKLVEASVVLQGLLCTTLCDSSLSAANRGTLKLGPKRVTALEGERERPAKTSMLRSVSATESGASLFSFHPNWRSISVRLRAA